jgi:putative toxin-antitoxin system antitoxin component (TIGR02293 family)
VKGRKGGLPIHFYDRLRGKLGVAPIRSDGDLASLVENQLPATVIQWLMRGGLSDAEVYQLILPRRTLAHRVARHQPLSREESDKAVWVARITSMAEQVFGDSGRAWRWLRKPKKHFDGKTPMDKLETEAGARLVEEIVQQINHGLLA